MAHTLLSVKFVLACMQLNRQGRTLIAETTQPLCLFLHFFSYFISFFFFFKSLNFFFLGNSYIEKKMMWLPVSSGLLALNETSLRQALDCWGGESC